MKCKRSHPHAALITGSLGNRRQAHCLMSVLLLIALMGSHLRGASYSSDSLLELPLDAIVSLSTIQPRTYAHGHVMPAAGSGTGIYVRDDGRILTNCHVVANAQRIDVQEYSGDQFTAVAVAVDPLLDLAVLKPVVTRKIKSYYDLQRKAEPVRGMFITYTGCPLKLPWTTCFGRVSVPQRVLPPCLFYEFIQIECNSSPGGSGALVTTLDGRAIGLLTRYAVMNANVGFVIPVEICSAFLQETAEKNAAEYTWTGFTLSEDRVEGNCITLVSDVVPGSPAFAAGLRIGQRVVRIDGRPVTERSPRQWHHAFYRWRGPEPIRVETLGQDHSHATHCLTPKRFAHLHPARHVLGERGVVIEHFGPYTKNKHHTLIEPAWLVTEILDQRKAQNLAIGDVITDGEVP